MEFTELIGYLGAILIGLSLGLIGGGGSILTVPVLVYLLGINPVLATAYSLFVVGSTSLIGSFTYMKKELVSYKTAVVFAVPSFIAVFLTRMYLVPAIPQKLISFDGFVLTKDIAVMVFFAIIMILASVSMIFDKKSGRNNRMEDLRFNYPLIALEGLLVGTLTGIVGAGGGFLIIPALVLLVRLPMKMAVGTSLLIVAVKSLIGFIGDIENQPIDWDFMLIFTLLSIIGIFIGSWLSKHIKGSHLKRGFGYFVLVMGAFILIKELLL